MLRPTRAGRLYFTMRTGNEAIQGLAGQSGLDHQQGFALILGNRICDKPCFNQFELEDTMQSDPTGPNLMQRWAALPGWMRTVVTLVLLFGFFYVIDRFDTLFPTDGYGTLWLMLGVVTIVGLPAIILSLRYETPEQLLTEVDQNESPQGRKRRRWLWGAVVIGGLLCVGLMWFTVAFVSPGDSAQQTESVVTVAVLMLFVIAGLPVLSLAVLLLAGRFVPGSWLVYRYHIQVAAEPSAVWAARRDVPRAGLVTGSIAHAEEIKGADVPTWRLKASGLAAKLMGLDQEVSLRDQRPDTLLTIESRPASGGAELTRFAFAPATEGGTNVTVDSLVRLNSPPVKAFTLVAGPANIANGGAAYEARRFAKLLEVKATASDVRIERYNTRPDVDF